MKRFTKNDEGFACAHCGRTVEKLGYSSRNHCPFCLYSLHVDLLPGDRANPCGGLMRPTGLEVGGKKGYVITHTCTRCGAAKRNAAARDDDRNALIALSVALP